MIEEYVCFIKQFVEKHEGVKVQNLSGKINRLSLKAMHHKMDRRKAKGVDGVGKEEYEKNLDANLESLEGRLKRDAYNPKPSKRVYIPKTGGKLRPLGISCYEDKLVEANVAELDLFRNLQKQNFGEKARSAEAECTQTYMSI